MRTKIALAVVAVLGSVLVLRWWDRQALVRAVLDAGTPDQMADALVGEDLKRLPDGARTRVLDALRALAGKPDYWQTYDDGSPHRLFRWSGSTSRWVLVVTYEGMNMPANVSWMAVHQFDATWHQTSVISFPTGYRIALFDVWKQDADVLLEPVIVVRLGSDGAFGDYSYRQRQYYAVREGRVVMVRIEAEGGEAERAIFRARHPWNGPKPPARTVDEWIEMLASTDTVDVLEVLTWLGGFHLSSAEPRQANVNQESVEDSRLWETVRDDPRTAARITTLQDSGNAWVCAAARLAAKR